MNEVSPLADRVILGKRGTGFKVRKEVMKSLERVEKQEKLCKMNSCAKYPHMI
jgi:hypothetical protein